MSLIKVEKFDEVHVRVFSDHSVEMELYKFFAFRVPGYQFMPKFKAKMWDGYARLYNIQTKKLYAGLIEYIKEFAEINGYEIEIGKDISYDMNVSLDQVADFTKSINPCSKGNPIEIRDYQLGAVQKALNDCRVVLQSPTSSGKSLIIYTLLRWFLEKDMKVLIIVPTTSLCEQLYSDFEDYSTGNGWSTKVNCQKLYSGLSKDFTTNVLITTWQSTFKMPKEWNNQFDAVINDECHLATGASITSMFEKMTEVKYRIGTTGTIDTNAKINQLQLEGIMGPIHKVITTRELMDSNRIVNLDIKCLLMKYNDDYRKLLNKCLYKDEVDFIISNNNRNKFIANLALKQDGNTLVLFQFVAKHGKVLHKMIEARAEDGRKIFFVSGEVKTEVREHIRKAVEFETNAIIVASFQTFSTGINIPSIENIIFASPTKSKIRNLQSIGRGLRLRSGKESCTLYDIADDLSWKKNTNHTLKHLAERIKTYSEEQFDFNIHNIDI